MRKTVLPVAPLVMLTASTQSGALCGLEFSNGFWRKSIQAFSIAFESAPLLSLGGRPPLNASCATADVGNRLEPTLADPVIRPVGEHTG